MELFVMIVVNMNLRQNEKKEINWDNFKYR